MLLWNWDDGFKMGAYSNFVRSISHCLKKWRFIKSRALIKRVALYMVFTVSPAYLGNFEPAQLLQISILVPPKHGKYLDR